MQQSSMGTLALLKAIGLARLGQAEEALAIKEPAARHGAVYNPYSLPAPMFDILNACGAWIDGFRITNEGEGAERALFERMMASIEAAESSSEIVNIYLLGAVVSVFLGEEAKRALFERMVAQTNEAGLRISGALVVVYWADPERRARHGELTRQRMAVPAVRERISAATKAAHNVPGMRQRKLAGLQRAFADLVLRRRISEATKAGMADPNLHRKISEATKAGIAAKVERQLGHAAGCVEGTPKAVRERFLRQIAAAHRTGSS
jgi:hypothetical protein